MRALIGRGAGAERRQDPRRLCQRAGLAGRGRPQQRHHRQSAAARTGSATMPMSGSSRKGRAGRAHEELAARQRSLGGENDAPSRNISRFLDRSPTSSRLGLDVRQIWRNDRFGRGGDHTEFLNARLPGGPLHRRDRELQLAAPGSEDRERHRLWRHDRPYGLPLSDAR